jgi:tetratricopeptide (TPR) repeat protein
VPEGLAFSAALGPGGELEPVVGLERKIAAARRELPACTVVVASAAMNEPGARAVRDVPELLALAFGGDAARAAALELADVEGLVRLGVELYEKRQSFAAALEVLSQAQDAIAARRAAARDPALFRVEEFVARWRAGSALVHLGDPDQAAPLLESARALADELWRAGELNPQLYTNARGNLAVLLRDLGRYREAERLLDETLQLQRALHQDKREIARTLGNLGELYTFLGEHARAEAALREALAALRAVYTDEVPRELCYLGNLELRRGDPTRALELYADALAANRSVAYGREINEAFVRYGQVRALNALSRADEARQLAQRALTALPRERSYPRQLIHKQLGLALIACGERSAGRAALREAADLTFARGALARGAFATALAELALDLGACGELAAASECAEAFAEASEDLLDRLWRSGRAAAVRTAAARGDSRELELALRTALALVPY